MIQREFFAALAKCRNGWNVYDFSEIRHGTYDGHCPITAVAEAETAEEYEPSMYRAAANAIGLPIKLANRIATAADWRTKEPRLRKRILAALGLSE